MVNSRPGCPQCHGPRQRDYPGWDGDAVRSSHRLVRSVGALLILAAFALGCNSSPFQRLDPSGTKWTVTEIAGVELPVDDLVTVAFDESGGYVITGPCRVVTGEIWIDTDGQGFGFFSPTVHRNACTHGAIDEAAVSALLGVEGWDVLSADRILLLGPSRIELVRASGE